MLLSVRRTRPIASAFVVFALLLTGQAAACLWDRDTLKMERRAFPKLHNLIVGKVLVHSGAFYTWRVTDRLEKLERRPKDLRLLDDLGVAYDKLGKHQEAIRTGRRTLALDPKRYESNANLGTFLIHRGKLSEGLGFIRRALQINPAAHFGRERYQQWLVEYVLGRDKGGVDGFGFARFLARRLSQGRAKAELEESKLRHVRALTPKQQRAAVKGIAGMLRFGRIDSPLLMEALAGLLVEAVGSRRRGRHYNTRFQHRRLAVRALFRARELSASERRRRRIQSHIENLASLIYPGNQLSRLQRRFDAERGQARQWLARVHANEKRWIAAGLDVDAKFEATYLR